MIEALIASYCAPALAGIKPANIVTCQKAEIGDIHLKIEKLNKQLNVKDIYIEILCECERRALIIVYRKDILEKHLMSDKNRVFLMRYGYAGAESLGDFLGILRTRLTCDDFPHEIGVFLGYPLHDIYCFINHRSEGCLLTGEWKVYSNPEEAKRMFGRFKACRKEVAKRLSEGRSLAQIFCAV